MIKQPIKSAVGFWLIFLLCFSPVAFAQTAKLAIVIDDLGYQQREDGAILAMPKEISIAIIPSAPYARQINQLAKTQNRDILIHMPMQPLNGQKIEAGGLHLGMSAKDVSTRVQNAKSVISNAIGLNNHMGSAATSDPRLMEHLMTELNKQHLFFLDSRTIGRSVAAKIARENGVAALERHIFLDDSDNYAEVYGQFQKAVQYARKHGTAIAIGHPRKNTVAVLQAGLRNLPSDVQLVGLGSLWRKEKVIPPQPFILLFNNTPAPTSVTPFESVPLLRGVPE